MKNYHEIIKKIKPTIFKQKNSRIVIENYNNDNRFSSEKQTATDKKIYLNKDLITLSEPQSIESEQFRMLKTNLLFPVSGDSHRVIMVTSAMPGEGKTFVAANMAVSIAQSVDKHVLLMDCDLRLPSIHKRFGFGDVPGLSDYLSDGISIPSLLLKTNVDKLTILPAGKTPHNPSELLSSEQMSQLIKEVKERYSDRLIIIDTAPPQLTSEGAAIARQVDGIILVVNYGNTRREIVKELIDTLGKEKIIGVVINRFDMRSSTYYSYVKYKKYGKYFDKG